jgi:hypothetical protein
VQGADVWPLYEPRSAPPHRSLPWPHLLDLVADLLQEKATNPDGPYGSAP